MNRKSLTVILILVTLSIAAVGLATVPQATQEAKVTVTAKGFEPATLNLKADVPAKITFLRETDDTCATSVLFPDYKIQKDLPLKKAVVIELTPKKGTFNFACGANMVRGKLVVQ